MEQANIGRDVALKLVQAIESADPTGLAGLFSNDAVMRHPLSPEPIEGRAAIAASEQVLFDAFSDIDVDVLRVVSLGEDVVLEVVLRATNTGPIDLGNDQSVPPTGRRIEIPAAWFLSIDPQGQIKEERDYLDTASFFRQLGLAGES